MNTFFEQRNSTGPTGDEGFVVNVYTQLEKSEILGFGGAFTEAAAYNYHLADNDEKKKLIEKYFSREKGIGYNFCRLHIGSCDFALDEYSLSYKEDLSDFSIERDKKYIIPFVKDALEYTGGNIYLFASPWSPPAFMKDNNALIGGGKLKKEFYPVYAEYFVEFLKAYKDEGITVSAITVQNEPKAAQTWESCQWAGEEEAEFAVSHLRPALDKNGFENIRILLWDHNKERLFDRACEALSVEGADDAVWGFGFHWYSGNHFDTIDLVRKNFPGKMILETELCHGDSHDLTDEERAEEYAIEYCENINHGANGICDWNLILDTKEGGPFHCRKSGGCYAPVYFDNETKVFKEDAVFGPVGIFSKYIDRGDKSLETTCFSGKIHTAAIKKKDGRIFVFIVNTLDKETKTVVRIDNKKTASFTVPAKSVSANEIM